MPCKTTYGSRRGANETTTTTEKNSCTSWAKSNHEQKLRTQNWNSQHKTTTTDEAASEFQIVNKWTTWNLKCACLTCVHQFKSDLTWFIYHFLSIFNITSSHETNKLYHFFTSFLLINCSHFQPFLFGCSFALFFSLDFFFLTKCFWIIIKLHNESQKIDTIVKNW